jgi:hypothetical protein
MRLLRIGTDGETGNRMTKYVRQTVTVIASPTRVYRALHILLY